MDIESLSKYSPLLSLLCPLPKRKVSHLFYSLTSYSFWRPQQLCFCHDILLQCPCSGFHLDRFHQILFHLYLTEFICCTCHCRHPFSLIPPSPSPSLLTSHLSASSWPLPLSLGSDLTAHSPPSPPVPWPQQPLLIVTAKVNTQWALIMPSKCFVCI